MKNCSPENLYQFTLLPIPESGICQYQIGKIFVVLLHFNMNHI